MKKNYELFALSELFVGKVFLNSIKDDTFIERLKMLKESHSNEDWWEQISDEEKSAIEKGLADIEAGRITPHSDVKKLFL